MGFTLDWRERPAVSPFAGFLIQRRAGRSGNFEAVIPWPDGGLAHYWRDMEDPAMPWHGPTLFAQGARYVGASLVESDFAAFRSASLKNLEVVATREDGALEHWWRENGGAMVWFNAGVVFNGAVGTPAITYTGALFDTGILDQDLDSHLDSEFYVAAPMSGGGFELTRQLNREDGIQPWSRLGGPGPTNEQFGGGILADRQFVGLGLALTTLFNPTVKASWKEMREAVDFPLIRGEIMVAAVSDRGALQVYAWGSTGSLGGAREGWREGLTVTLPTELGHVLRPCRGRPCLLQSDYGLDEESGLIPLDSAHYGNLELVAPASDGGILHFWRDNGEKGEARELDVGWSFASKIGTAQYDEVSLIQSNFGGEHGNLEMIARHRAQRGFDFFWRDEHFAWHGPFAVTSADPPTGTVSQPLSAADGIAALSSVNIDFSVPRADLEEWLGNPGFTPYPAISTALFALLRGRRLKGPAFIDVIVFNYEHTPDVPSPRAVSDVRADVLKAAVLAGYNVRHGAAESDFDAILA